MRAFFTCRAAAGLAALLFSIAAHAAEGIEKAASVEGITEYRLGNGLKVLLFPDPTKPTITVNVTYLVGSRHENYGETGMAHLLEHMVFKGTPKNPKIWDQLRERGARANGTTSFDRTNYFESFPASDENLKWALELEADRMVNSNIARADLDSEMTVVRNEYERGENEPTQVLNKRMHSIAFDWHNYQNSTIGNRSDIENVGIDNLRAFYRMYYQPDNAVLLVAGKFDEARALALVADSFGRIAKPARELPKLWTVEPTQDGERSFVVRRAGDVQIVMVSYKVPGTLHPDTQTLPLAAQILARTPTGRLHKVLVESGKAASVGAFTRGTLQPGLFSFIVTVKKDGSLEEAQKILIETLEDFHNHPPTEEEMRRARTILANGAQQAMSSPEALAVGLSETIALGDWRIFFHARERAQKVTSAEIAAAAAKYFRRDNRTVGQFIPVTEPQRAELPPAPSAEAVLKDFKGGQAVAAGEAFDPTPANIDARTVRRQLPGGMKVAMLTKKTRGETVNVSIELHWGDRESLRGKAATARLMDAMISRGTTRYTREQLADRFNALRISGGVASGAAFQTTRENLPEALRLVAHVMKEPAFLAAEFDQAQRQALTALERRAGEPGAQAADRLARHYNAYPKDDWRYAPSTEEAIEMTRAVTLDDVKALHRDFLGASYADLAIVGDFDPNEAMAVIEAEFDPWKSPHTYERIAREYRDVPPLAATLEIPDKANAVFLARLMLPVRDDDPAYPEYPALALANYMIGGSGISSRLGSRIRNREGLSYGVGTSLSNNSRDHITTFSATATAAPQNMEKLEQIFREELQRAVSEGFSDAEIAAAKSGYLQARAQARSRDPGLAASWTDKLQRGRTFAEAARYEERIAALTREDVQAALRKHLDVAKISIVKAGSFAKPQ
jgi:zinc protease